jgi:hypothetical protein
MPRGRAKTLRFVGSMVRSVKRARRARRQVRRGQAMVEYSLIMVLLLMGAVGGGLIVFLPAMMNSLDIYLTGIYYMVSAAIP